MKSKSPKSRKPGAKDPKPSPVPSSPPPAAAAPSAPAQAPAAAENLALAEAQAEADAEEAAAQPGGQHPEWLICETPAGPEDGRTFIFHLCPGGSESFLAEVFDGPPPLPPGGGQWEGWPLDDGQTFANILWLDGGEVPRDHRQKLYEEAVCQLRAYDAALNFKERA